MHLRRLSCVWGIAAVAIAGLGAPAWAAPFALSVQANGDDRLYRIDLATGVATPVGNVGFSDVSAVTFHPTTGVLYGLDQTAFTFRLITINPTTGGGAAIGNPLFDPGDALTFNQTGDLFRGNFDPAGSVTHSFSRLHASTARAIGLPIEDLNPAAPVVKGLAFRDGTLYGIAGNTNTLVAVHPVTGHVRTIAPLGVSLPNASGIGFDRNGVLWGIETGGRIFQVNPQTGAATLGALTSAGFKGLHVIKPVPVFTGAGPGGGPHVVGSVDTNGDGSVETITASFFAYAVAFPGGVRVARCDVDGDGIADTITAAGPGGGPQVRVFNGRTGVEIFSFFAYSPAFTGGVYVACGDVNGDGKADIITGAGEGGGPHVRVFSGASGEQLPGPAASFLAYSPGFTGGVRVASCDVNGDGVPDIITAPGPGSAQPVQVFNGATGALLPGLIGTFFPYGPAHTSGVFVGCGDLNGDGKADVITGPGAGTGPTVQAFSGATGLGLQSFNAYAPGFLGGVSVAAGDVNGDGRVDIITGAGPGGGPHVKVFDGVTPAVVYASFFAYPSGFTGGVWVAGGVGF